MKHIIFLIALMLAGAVYATPSNTSEIKNIHNSGLLKEVYKIRAQQGIQSLQPKLMSLEHDKCHEESHVSCSKVACAQSGARCHANDGLERIIQLCRGVAGECVEDACAQSGARCHANDGLERVIQLCQSSRGSCVKEACAQSGARCHANDGLEKIIQLCQKVPTNCVKDSCAQSGARCHAHDGLERIIQLCKGN